MEYFTSQYQTVNTAIPVLPNPFQATSTSCWSPAPKCVPPSPPCLAPPLPLQPKKVCFVPAAPVSTAVASSINSSINPLVAGCVSNKCDVSKPLWILGSIIVIGFLIWLITFMVSQASKPAARCQGFEPTPNNGCMVPPVPIIYPPVVPPVNPPVVPPVNPNPSPPVNPNPPPPVNPNPPVNPSGPLVPSNATRIDSNTFNNLKVSGNTFIVMFYSDGCGFCKTAFPQYDSAARGSKVPMYVLNGAPAGEHVRGFPTVRAYNHHGRGSLEDYSGPRSAVAYRQYAQNIQKASGAENPLYLAGQQMAYA